MHAITLLIRLSAYYAIVGAALWLATYIFPELTDFLPFGGATDLISKDGITNGGTGIEINVTAVRDLSGSIVWLVGAIFGALLTILPVSWTYIHCRDKANYDQSIVETVIMLPLIVTAIVVIVHNSLALAFSLAGIVGAVRFRNTLKSSADALYIFVAIGVGLAAGVGALEIAIVMTMAVAYGFGLLWLLDYGAQDGTQRYLREVIKEDSPEDIPEGPDLRVTKKGRPKKTPAMKARRR